jgi:nucleotide-binding universal stress UspA family protein
MYKRILVPVDGSETAMFGLHEAIRLAKNQRATLRLFHVVNDFLMIASPEAAVFSHELLKNFRDRGEAVLADAASLARKQGLEPETKWVEALSGPAGAAIVEQATSWPADLIVLGTHGRRGFRRLVMGSDAEYVVRTTPVPVLLVRGTKAVP